MYSKKQRFACDKTKTLNCSMPVMYFKLAEKETERKKIRLYFNGLLKNAQIYTGLL